MRAERPLTIVGGGLAGLALGAALARAGAAVTLCEAGRVPRHRVCGEFLSGWRPAAVARLGLEPHLRGAALNRTTGWYAGGRRRFSATLPEPALGLSRRVLEERLCEDFAAAGGVLREQTRVAAPSPAASAVPSTSAAPLAAGASPRLDNTNSENIIENSVEEMDAPGFIWAAGRRADPSSPWLGLKVHCRDLRLAHDLELHLGRGGYAGAARVEDGRVNVCGLFRTRPGVRVPREHMLAAYLAACGLDELAERMTAGAPDPASATAVSGLDFTRTWSADPRLTLGDHHAPIPPYTGHGMAMAIESAAAALDPLLAYTRGEKEWKETARAVRHNLDTRQDTRLRWARRLHPWILHPAGQTTLVTLARCRLLPFGWLYGKTNG